MRTLSDSLSGLACPTGAVVGVRAVMIVGVSANEP